MNKLFLLTILSISLLACKKQTPTFKISGVITDKSLNSGLSNANITFYKVKAGTTNSSKIISTSTDSNGNYTIEFDRDQSESYYVKVEKGNYFEVYKEIAFSSLKVGKTNTRNYDIYAKSWIKIHLQNLTPESGDYITISKQEGKKDCSECCSFYQLTTTNSDTLFYCVNDGNTNYSILYSSFGDQILKTDIKEIKTIPFDTSELKIEY